MEFNRGLTCFCFFLMGLNKGLTGVKKDLT